MEPLMLFIFLYFILAVVILWNPRYFHRTNKPNGNLLLVIAHPDDESMFFGPAISSFLSSINKLYILCLSDGNENGLGLVRQEELIQAASIFKIDSSQIIQINSKYLVDGPKEKWDVDLIYNLISDTIKANRIDSLVTFDSYGVSGHPNHISIYKASKYMQGVTIYNLVSTGIWRKYISFLDLPISCLQHWLCSGDRLLVLSSFDEYRLTKKALKKHASQMVWFRKLYALFSRYMFVNTFLVKKMHD